MGIIGGNPRVRVLGHAYTVWTWGGNPIAYCTNVQHSSPQPLAQSVDVQPLNYVRPAEIVTGRAITGGDITMQVTELYMNSLWHHLGNSFGANGDFHDLASIFHKVQRDLTEHGNTPIKLLRIVRPPGKPAYHTQYYGVRITDIREDENTTVDATVNSLSMSVRYAYKMNHFNDVQDPQTVLYPRVYGDT